MNQNEDPVMYWMAIGSACGVGIGVTVGNIPLGVFAGIISGVLIGLIKKAFFPKLETYSGVRKGLRVIGFSLIATVIIVLAIVITVGFTLEDPGTVAS